MLNSIDPAARARVLEIIAWGVVFISLALYTAEAWVLATAIFASGQT